MKIIVLGDTGMLGGMASRYFKSAGYNVVGLSRSNGFKVSSTQDISEMFFNLHTEILDSKDVVVLNCIGAIKPVFNNPKNVAEAIYTNAIFPRQLADWIEGWNNYSKHSPFNEPDRPGHNVKLIHITTDCVFSGNVGLYDEKSPHDALDEYGKSKSLGEPSNCMVIRTSIIGPEWNGNKKSLVEWLVSNRGKEVNGFLNHMWNGLTTLELCKCIDKIIKQDLISNGTVHLFSNDVTKCGMLMEMSEAWGLGVKVNIAYAPTACDRTMRTVKELNSIVSPQQYHLMIRDLKEFICSR